MHHLVAHRSPKLARSGTTDRPAQTYFARSDSSLARQSDQPEYLDRNLTSISGGFSPLTAPQAMQIRGNRPLGFHESTGMGGWVERCGD